MLSLYLVSSLTFGRDSARYLELIAVLAVVSIVLWAFVLITTLLRFAMLMRYRHARLAADNARLRATSGQ